MESSPNYGPAGAPSQGRIVRLHLSDAPSDTTPAIIQHAISDTGRINVAYDCFHEGGVCERLWAADVPFKQADADSEHGLWWDYFPRV